MWKSKLFWRFFAVYAVLILIAGSVLVSWFSQRQRLLVLEQVRSNLRTASKLLERSATAILRDGPSPSLQSELISLEEVSEIRITVVDPQGVVIADSSQDPALMDNHFERPEVQAARVDGEGWSERTSPTLDRPMLYHALRMGAGETTEGYIRTAFPMSSVERRIDVLQRIMTGLGVGLCFVASIATYLLVLRIVGPLRQMTDVAGRIAGGDFSVGPSVSTGDELEALADTLDNMRRQLQSRLEQLDRQNEKVLESSERLRTVLGAMIEGVVAVDERQRILFANRTAMNIFDFSDRDLLDRPLVEVIRHPRVLEVVQEVLKQRKLLAVEIELPRKEMVVSLIASRFPGEPAGGVVMVFHDVSELRRLENLRREFMSNVSHELKTPLASIQAYTETLLEGAIDDPHSNRNFLERIAAQAERLHTLIIDMLKIAQVESGQQMFDLTAVPLKETLLDCLLEHEALAETRQIALEYEPPPQGDGVAVHADAQGLRTIIDNLLDNAVKYTSEGGQVKVAWELRGNRVLVKVSDTGVGIAPEHQTRIFERFYRVDKARSREMGGTGLGLSIVKHLVQVFGGTISVDSRPGLGSTFTVELPQA